MYEIIETTTDKLFVAEKIANSLLDNKLSKCVQIIKNEKSLYGWRGSVQSTQEYLLRIKIDSKIKNNVIKIIKNESNYEVPELISYKMEILNNEYREWLEN